MKALPLTVDVIKALYPRPTSLGRREQEAHPYCVGGAFCHWSGSVGLPFPTESQLARRLGKHGVVKATQYALKIIISNDRGDFEAAWESLGEALSTISSTTTPGETPHTLRGVGES